MQNGDSEALIEIVLIDLLECLEDVRNSSVRQMIHSRETDFAVECQVERYFVHKEYISGHEHIMM